MDFSVNHLPLTYICVCICGVDGQKAAETFFHKNDQAFYNVIIEKFNQSQDYNEFGFFSFLVRGGSGRNWMKTFHANRNETGTFDGF